MPIAIEGSPHYTTKNQQPKTNNPKPTTNNPQPCFVLFLTAVNTFSHLFPEKYFLSFVIPPFHLRIVTTLIINGLSEVELQVEYGWNYMKFHPYSTHNSTTPNTLMLNTIIYAWWKGGITNEKKYFMRIIAEKLVTTQVGLPYSYYDETIAA